VRQVARALGRAHQLGIVHRDIKPDNIFLADAEGQAFFVKVLDFGVAKQPVSRDQAMTSTGSSFGTPMYMSPEQLRSAKHVDFQRDPAARFGSVKEMASALDEAVLGLERAPKLPASARAPRPGPPPCSTGGAGAPAHGPGGAGSPHGGGQARTFNGLVMPGAGARRGGAGVLIAGVALAGAAALGLGIPWM
ncbi:protein kinase domain-containing protein, partial [Sorangium cellulosum]|uniref:protein kinase domain-containing protein n=1 Tax=Sorangium cellulosum TaxID=56 RepID=UPI001F267D47